MPGAGAGVGVVPAEPAGLRIYLCAFQRGGESTWDNLVACCRRCNHQKGSRTPEEARMHLIRRPRAFSLHVNRQIMRYIGRADETWRKYLFYESGVRVEILRAGRAGWQGKATHLSQPGRSCVVFVGSLDGAEAPRTDGDREMAGEEGIPLCDRMR